MGQVYGSAQSGQTSAMKWRGRRGGGRIEDRRGQGGGLGTGGGMPFPIPIGKGGGGIGMILIVLLLVFVLPRCLGSDGSGFGIDPGTGPLPQSPQAGSGDLNQAPADDPGKFVDVVVGDVDATWKRIFSQSDQTYEQPVIVLYDDAVRSACGATPSTVGPFYCPLDKKVYLDLPFLEQLQQRLGAPGDFAQAYVIAHEIGHHVQNLLGVMEDVNLARQENPDDANELSVRLELQADCLAGVWAHSAVQAGICSSPATSRKG